MKFRTVMVAAAAAALSFGAVSSAAAQTLGHASPHRAAARQITGSRLAKGLLPTSAFGGNYTRAGSVQNSGGKLASTRIRYTPASLSCGSFVNTNYTSGWGNTAGADVIYLNPDWFTNWPFSLYSVTQEALQFATTHAASTFFNQAYAKYAACHSFTVPNPTDSTPGGGSWNVSNGSAKRVSVGGRQAFWASEQWDPSETTLDLQYAEVLFVVSGTNVYYLWEDSGTTDEPSTSIMGSLIHRVQRLY